MCALYSYICAYRCLHRILYCTPLLKHWRAASIRCIRSETSIIFTKKKGIAAANRMPQSQVNTSQNPPRLSFHPPLLNSASPWATNINDLRALLQSSSTGAITTRTSLLQEDGFNHQPDLHRYTFFNPITGHPHSNGTSDGPVAPTTWDSPSQTQMVASLNSLGYSPISLSKYLCMLQTLSQEMPHVSKTVVISVTGSPDDVAQCYHNIVGTDGIHFPLAMEVNLSCPNIPGTPPPAYDNASLEQYLQVLPAETSIPIGVKTPPYTHDGQFTLFTSALRKYSRKISFITAINTLGTCLVLTEDDLDIAALPSEGGLGGMAGPPLHPLALGNVRSLKRAIEKSTELNHISIIGVGGVSDGNGYKRMKTAGADMVAVATGLGRFGLSVFDNIAKDIGDVW